MSNPETFTFICYVISFVIFIILNYKDLKDADDFILPSERNKGSEKCFEDP